MSKCLDRIGNTKHVQQVLHAGGKPGREGGGGLKLYAY